MIQDVLTTQKLLDTYQLDNAALRICIDTELSKPRTVDGPPSKYSPLRIECIENIEPFGVYTDYRRQYATQYGAQEPAEGHIAIKRENVACTYRVLTALKALILCGVSKSTERATACREVFGALLSRRKSEILNEDLIQPALRPTGDYYKDEIIRAIIDSIYSQEEQVEMKLKSAMKDGYTPDVRELFPNVVDMDSFNAEIKKQYTRACCDPDFKVRKHLGRIVNVVNYLKAGGRK